MMAERTSCKRFDTDVVNLLRRGVPVVKGARSESTAMCTGDRQCVFEVQRQGYVGAQVVVWRASQDAQRTIEQN